MLHVLNPRGAYAGKMRVTGNKVTFWLLTEVGRLLSAEYHRSRVELLLWQSAKYVGQKAQKCDEQLFYLTKNCIFADVMKTTIIKERLQSAFIALLFVQA